MFSIGEMVVLCVAAAWIFGPNELPRVARQAGRLTGQATGFLYRTRAKFFQFAEEAEVTKLHEEMQATMYQLNAIRAELQGGMNLFNPGPVAQRVLSIKPVPGQDNEGSSSFAAQQQQQQMQQAGQAGQAAPQAPAWVPEPAAAVQQPPFQQQQSAAALGASFAASALQASAAAPQVPGPGAAPTAAQPPRQQMQAQQGQELGEEQHPLMLPVSAVAAGWAPDRAGKAPTGSEIFLDALAEELVAAHVLRFQQAQMQQRAAAQAQQQGAAAGAQQQGTAQPAEAAAPQPGQPAPSKDA